jgi:hypothetical protein
MLHWQALNRARLLVLADQARYNAAWTAILNKSEEMLAVAALCLHVQELAMQLTQRPLQLQRAHFVPETAVESINSSALQSPVLGLFPIARSRISPVGVASLTRQRSRNSSFRRQPWEGLMDCGVDGLIDPQSPVDSLDQLYCQAVALSPILVAKVQKWASASSGCFYSAATFTSYFQRVGASLFQFKCLTQPKYLQSNVYALWLVERESRCDNVLTAMMIVLHWQRRAAQCQLDSCNGATCLKRNCMSEVKSVGPRSSLCRGRLRSQQDLTARCVNV